MPLHLMRAKLMALKPDEKWKTKILNMSDLEVRSLYYILIDWHGGYGQYE